MKQTLKSTKLAIILSIAILIFISAMPLSAQETKSFRTITDAYNFADTAELHEIEAVKKLIITDSIYGSTNFFNTETEWRMFRCLDEIFPNIEELELHTDQDIPDRGYAP